MRHRKLTIVIIFSLAFNVAFLASLGYKTWQKKRQTNQSEAQRRSQRTSSRGERQPSPEWKAHYERLRTQFLPQIKPLQEKLTEERKALGQLLRSEEPDTFQIELRLQNIAKFQSDIERAIVYFMFEEKKHFNPDERKKYIDRVIRRIEGGPYRERSGRRGENRKRSDKEGNKEK